MTGIPRRPTCKYCKQQLDIVRVNGYPGTKSPLKKDDPARVCPTCDAPGRLPPHARQ